MINKCYIFPNWAPQEKNTLIVLLMILQDCLRLNKSQSEQNFSTTSVVECLNNKKSLWFKSPPPHPVVEVISSLTSNSGCSYYPRLTHNEAKKQKRAILGHPSARWTFDFQLRVLLNTLELSKRFSLALVARLTVKSMDQFEELKIGTI